MSRTAVDELNRLTRLAQVAGEHWAGGFSQITLVKHRENAVFSARRPDGSRIAIRLHRAGYHSPAALHSELAWMQAIKESGDVEVPVVLPAIDGRLVVELDDPDEDGVGRVRHVSVLGWLDGLPAGTSEGGVTHEGDAAIELYRAAGALAGRLHEHSRTWAPPTGFTRHAWDLDGLVGEQPLWGRFWEYDVLSDAQRSLLVAARDRARADLDRLGRPPSAYGLIHADLVPENLLDHGGRLQLIDFDDAGYGWFGFELATALYFNRGIAGYRSVRAALLDGYRSVRPLSGVDEADLPMFLFLRGSTYLGWVQSRPGTETARELGPALVTMACEVARDYLDT